MSDTFNRIRCIIIDHFDIDPERVTEDSGITDLGADSLDQVELIMAIEEEFEIEIPDNEADRLQTVREIAIYVAERVKKREKTERAAERRLAKKAVEIAVVPKQSFFTSFFSFFR